MTIYTVKAGDTVYSIARDFGITPERLISLNELADPDMLSVGQSLVILKPARVYTVTAGETLTDIAAATGVTVNSLLRNNPSLGGEDAIYPGQVLVLEYDTPKLGTVSTNGYAYPNIDRAILKKTLPYLTYLTIFGYGITEDGALIETDDAELIELARSYGTAPVMLVSSLGADGRFSNLLVNAVLNSPQASERLINNIVNTLVEKRYDAVDVDFEYVLPEDREAYVRFIDSLRRAANERGKSVFVSLAPKTSADQRGLLYESHDYGALGNAANKALLMTYEWGYTYGPPMAVAPINKVAEVVDYALTELEPDRILMGMPNYAYDWKLPFVAGESRATSLGNMAAVELAGEAGAEIRFDEIAQTPYFIYTDEAGARHEVWFEDARSVYAKLMLILEKGLFGLNVWNIMKYFPSMWLVINASADIRRRDDRMRSI